MRGEEEETHNFAVERTRFARRSPRALDGQTFRESTYMKTRGLDFAHGCFLLWGLTRLSIGVIRARYTDAEWAGGAGGILLLLLPLIFVSFLAMLVGIVLAVRFWNNGLLAFLAGLSVLQIVTEFPTEHGPPAFQKTAPIVYGVIVATGSGLWFLVLRRRYRPQARPLVEE